MGHSWILSDSENVGVPIEISAILDLPVIPTSESIHSSLIVLMDADNVVQLLDFHCWQHFKICNLSGMCFRYYIRHFDFRLNTAGIQPGVTL